MYRLSKDPQVWENMKIHVTRFLTNILHPFSINPYSEDKNIGWKDLPHSYVNLFVEFSRESPYHAGHWFSFFVLLFVVFLFFSVVF